MSSTFIHNISTIDGIIKSIVCNHHRNITYTFKVFQQLKAIRSETSEYMVLFNRTQSIVNLKQCFVKIYLPMIIGTSDEI